MQRPLREDFRTQSRFPHNLLLRTCKGSCRASSKSQQGPEQDFGISTLPSQKNLCKLCKDTQRILLPDLYARRVQDHAKQHLSSISTGCGGLFDKFGRISTRPFEDFTRISSRSWQKELRKIMQGPVQDHAGTSSMISAGSPQDLARRACRREGFARISTQKEPCKIMQGPLGEDSTTVSTRSHGDLHCTRSNKHGLNGFSRASTGAVQDHARTSSGVDLARLFVVIV